jgi:hypothetical protein
MDQASAYTSSTLLAAAAEVLQNHGYQPARPENLKDWTGSNARIFEDAYGIVAVVVHETWQDLLSHWIDAQAALVDLISARVGRSEPKSWEGYLVLLTPSVMEAGSESAAQAIRYDTSRVRKLVASGDEISHLGDIERVLLPVLPIECEGARESETSVLHDLPEILAQKGISVEAARALIRAFSNQESLMDCLHSVRIKP